MSDARIREDASGQPSTDRPGEHAERQSEEHSVQQLESGTYEVIRNRLNAQGAELKQRLEKLNVARRDVFGSIETQLVATQRITTANNCIPRDMVALGDLFLFGYNVHIGLRSETRLSEVFAIYEYREETFHEKKLDLIEDPQFQNDFKQLYKYYKGTTFAKFMRIGPHLYMVFRVGRSVTDIKSFKWAFDGSSLRYIDNRSDHEVRYPAQHEFEWKRVHRDMHREGEHPHISIQDRLFVETVGGDLTIKVEDNTDTGEGIYAEEVDNEDQTLDDAEIFFACLEHIILLKIRPYQEKTYRHILYNEKVKKAIRLDSIENACVLLPEGHGLIFCDGFYLQTGEYKRFETDLSNLIFETRIPSPNGEDYLFVFNDRESGVNVLLSYNVIEQSVSTPIVCHGFSIFDNGRMILFKAQEDPQKHHGLQIWQTPYVGPDFEIPTKTESYLSRVGNRDVVRGMAEGHEILSLMHRNDTYADLYLDLVKKSGDVIDIYFWIGDESAFNLKEILVQIRQTATAAVNEFDKVIRVKKNTRDQFQAVSNRVRDIFREQARKGFREIDEFVHVLADLRKVRGEVISLRDLRYIEVESVDSLEAEIETRTSETANHCVQFLLGEGALLPYEKRVDTQRDAIDLLTKVTEAREVEKKISEASSELEMLIDIVSNLKIDDTTQRTRIIDNISEIYSHLNQTRALCKKKSRSLMSSEGIAEFSSQVKLLSQSVVNFLDVCDSPTKCDEYLTKLMVQVEELEGRFAEFEEFVVQLAEKREEIYTAFDTRKLALVEARNKRTTALMSAAERILGGIETRIKNLKEINEIHSYFAGDLMIDKVRDIVRQLAELDDSVKADDIQTRLKTIREDAVRQLKDRKELYAEGENLIRLGQHTFSVNVQPLDLTMVSKDNRMCFHLTGTNFLEEIKDEEFLSTRDVWDQEVVSENKSVYRAEYLAYQIVEGSNRGEGPSLDGILNLTEPERMTLIQTFMGPRYSEGYTKGVHDHDAHKILINLASLRLGMGRLKYHTRARALGSVFWTLMSDPAQKELLGAKIRGAGAIDRLFPLSRERRRHVEEIEELMRSFVADSLLFPRWLVPQAANFLFEEVATSDRTTVSHDAVEIYRAFKSYLQRQQFAESYSRSIKDLRGELLSTYRILRGWIEAFLRAEHPQTRLDYAEEVAAALLDKSFDQRQILQGDSHRSIEGLVGTHPVLADKTYALDHDDFMMRLETFEQDVVPRFNSYQATKRQLVETRRTELRLDEFKPRVLSSFVRNRLINEVYLPMVGDNLSKQIGVVGEGKRTDRMGLLLLISPPGYGKTTLMEYIANRLGVTFVKISGPAIGHRVTSLDPEEAPNASARDEVEKLNLSFEMGDNVMIYVDDIQHCNPEFLQKFISLCDATRRIEGVYHGKSKTYDLRGRKVAVVMAGNPYTESGEKFRIPDMLANRADTYNLGDVIGDTTDVFEMSYLENALTSSPILNKLASRSQKDVYSVIRLAEGGSPTDVEFEGNYSVEELDELVSTMKKLMAVRAIVLKVNALYISSAAQSDDYRTEPPFKLQGSYRDMNKMAESVVPIMNDEELGRLIFSHYENAAQTLTTDAESNLLKLKELLGIQSDLEKTRWADMKAAFGRNVVLRGVGGDDPTAQIIAQMVSFGKGLDAIRDSLDSGVGHLIDRTRETSRIVQQAESSVSKREPVPLISADQLENALEALEKLNSGLESISNAVASSGIDMKKLLETVPERVALAKQADSIQRLPSTPVAMTENPEGESRRSITIVNQVPRAVLDVIRTEFGLMEAWMRFFKTTKATTPNAKELKTAVDEAFEQYQHLIRKLERNLPRD